MAPYRPLFTFTCPIFCKLCKILVHYYKTKFEVSGEDDPKFLTSLYRIQNDRKSAISYLDWPDIGYTVPDR